MSVMLALLATAAAAPVAADPPVPDPQRDDVIVVAQRTEGSDDYTTKGQTTATRLPISQRETPQSVSVVTRAQIDDFQLNDVNALLTTVPGVNVQAAESDRFYYSARGFDIQTFQIDGVGLPFAFEVQTGSIDTAFYDHVEVLRGAPGLLSFTGNPSAVVNFIRKRPSRDLQATASAQYGSYDNFRLDADVSVPLTADGRIRARAVGAYFDTDSYLDRYGLRRWVGYGIVEADIGSNTVVSAGYGHQDHKSSGAMWGAIPIYYTDGSRIDLPRSANTGPDWAGWNIVDRQIFGDVTHDFGGGWKGKVSALRRAISEDDRLFYVYGNPDRATGLGVFTYPGAFRAQTRNLTLDANIGGPLRLFGREHLLMVGVNRSAQRYGQGSAYDNDAIGVSLPFDRIYDGSFPLPDFPSTYSTDPTFSQNTHQRRETVYGLFRANLADPLKVMLGANYTHAISEGYSYGSDTDYRRSKFLPFVGATLDLSANISVYASYASIFNPQSQFDAAGNLLDPIKGNNVEGGVKGEWFAGRLNASVAVFQARQDNTAEPAGYDTVRLRTIYRGVDAKSQGIELEVGGQLAPGLQATGGYTLLRVRGDVDRDGDGTIDGRGAARTFVPRNTARLNLAWSPTSLPKLKLGASAQYQSRIYNELDALTPAGTPIRLRQGGYALLDLLARWAFTPHVALSANVRNVTGAKYVSALNYDQGFYGAPRTVLGTLSVRY